MRTLPILLPFLAAASGCAFQGTPVPVRGDIQLLAGEWEGTYSSRESGRSGLISFALKAGTDSAVGDVVMIPNRPEHPPSPNLESGAALGSMSRLLRISFVWCHEGHVIGRLDPYPDPETGERILTTFEGNLRDEDGRFRGTFVSVYPGSGRQIAGNWEVARKGG